MRTDFKSQKHEWVIDEPESMGGQDSGPDPLTTLLSALAACENVTARFVAKELNFNLKGMRFQVEGILDPRGFMGDPNVKPYFEQVSIKVIVETDESEERLDELRRVTDSRCPVYNTLKAAGIKVKSEWTKG
ncbi:hypothetical protein GCM10010965_01150 [Caldalkalibacillus thermarum]|uniref:OsmC family protein n=1 Tax=Caldalkalibacillus thermarum TaxID=296745 RepID=UPI001669C5F5|nr:OsmC family protein [Caldalkalibacillus thermarum]GGK11946.1 hypothetical protein GCM10010965_01150 [Caldalkalibacillus thermarum]